MSDLFKIPERLPTVPEKVTMFRATQFDSLSSRDKAFQAALTKRTRQAVQVFEMKGETIDQGDRLYLRDGAKSLQIYCASDSLWWSNHDLAYSEGSAKPAKLPGEAEAKKIAARELGRVKIDAADAKASSVGFVEVSKTEKGGKPKRTQTAIDINYTFSLADLPVYGPGAKIKVSVADGGQLAQIIYFWRQPKKASSVPTISPQEAIEKFQRDPAFFRLRDTEAIIEVRNVGFGYYALPPGDFQRFYFPVYAVDGIVRTRELPEYEFRRYIVAVDLSAETAKEMDIVDNPAACRVFS